jgi:isopropylmalate/homocitrate/citramalate synthase
MGYREDGKWWVSPSNYVEEVTGSFHFPGKIEILDTTLRDGEQQAGIIFTREDKVRIAKKLNEVGVHRIEAGTPAGSQEDADAVRAIVDEGLDSKIFCFCRNMVKDMELAKSLGADGVIAEIIGSEHLLKYGKRWTLEKAIEACIEATNAAHELGLYVNFFPADGSRADINFLMDMVQAVAEGGHIDSLALVDTFGTFSPEGAAYTVSKLRERFDFPIEAHFHSDFDLGVATTIAALKAGAQVAHVTVNGIGERAGSAPLGALALSLEALYGQDTGIRLEKMKELSELVVELSNFPVWPIKAVDGDKLFGWETGLPSSLWVNAKETNPLIMLPYHYDLTGQQEPVLYLGKKSGKDNLKYWLRKAGVEMDDDKQKELLQKVKALSIEIKRDLNMDDFKALLATME